MKNPSKTDKHYCTHYLPTTYMKGFMTFIKTCSHQLFIWNPTAKLKLCKMSVSHFTFNYWNLSKTSPKKSILLLEWFKRLNVCLQSWIVVLLGTSFRHNTILWNVCLNLLLTKNFLTIFLYQSKQKVFQTWERRSCDL